MHIWKRKDKDEFVLISNFITMSSKKVSKLKETPFIPPKDVLHLLPNEGITWDNYYKKLIEKEIQSYEKYLPTQMTATYLRPYLPQGKSQASNDKHSSLHRSESNNRSSGSSGTGKRKRLGGRCLYVGFGLSKLGSSLLEIQPQLQMEQIDISSVATQLASSVLGIVSRTMNVTNLTYDNNWFDLIIDKGTFDSIVSFHSQIHFLNALEEIHRVLKPQGYFVMFSCQSGRSNLLLGRKKFYWDLVDVQKIDPFGYNAHYIWMYVLRKWPETKIQKMEGIGNESAKDIQTLAESLLKEASLADL